MCCCTYILAFAVVLRPFLASIHGFDVLPLPLRLRLRLWWWGLIETAELSHCQRQRRGCARPGFLLPWSATVLVGQVLLGSCILHDGHLI